MAEHKQTDTDEAGLFAEEMARLGLERPVDGNDETELSGESGPASRPPGQDWERQEFLAALENAAIPAEPGSPSEDSPGSRQAQARRLRQVARGRLHPEAELDLHGRTRAEAEFRLRNFLDTAVYRGWQTVLVITGKGHHSTDRPVLRDAVEEVLRTCRPPVIEWGIAPRRYGGGGALVVFLQSAD